MCADTRELEFYGTFSDFSHTYFHFELLACTPELLNAIPGYETAECAKPMEIKIFFMTHLLIGLTSNSFVDSTEFDDPIKTQDEYIFNDQLDPDKNIRREVTLNYNIAKFNDKLFQFSDDLEIEKETFLTIDQVRDQNIQALNPTAYF